MGLIGDIFGIILGGGRNAIRETVEVFRPNAEMEAVREAAQRAASLAQFAAEFAQPKLGLFDRFIDGLNRLPRPMLALGTLGLFISAMVDPVWFSQRMQGIALVPEPLWWLMGAIVSFYFERKRFPRLLRIFLYSLIALQQFVLILVIGLGFFDVWLNFRKIKPPNTEQS